MERHDPVRRGVHFRGWMGAFPGFAALTFLIFLPAFINLAGAIFHPGGVDPGQIILRPERGAYTRAVIGGPVGGVIACAIGLLAGSFLAGKRYSTLVLFFLCIPAVFGEAAASSVFGTVLAGKIEALLPANGVIPLALYEAWRLIGPASLMAMLLVEREIGAKGLEKVPIMALLRIAWRRWKLYAGGCLLAGFILASIGAGHIPVETRGESGVNISGPAEISWRNPGHSLTPGWMVSVWIPYIITTFILVYFILKLSGWSKTEYE